MQTFDWLGRRAALTPERVALIDGPGGRRITYEAWNRSANRTARLLLRLGVRRGDLVAVLAHNSVAYLDLLFGAGKIGAVLQCLNWRLRPGELGALLDPARRARPVLLCYGPECRELAAALRPSCAGVRFVALQGPADSEGDVSLAEREALPDAPPDAGPAGLQDPWVICYTGGSTGLPKGALLTHGGMAANAMGTVLGWGLRPDDVTILDAPLFHTGGLNVLTLPLVAIGGTSVVCPRFSPEQTIDLLRDEGVTVYFGVPTMFLMLQEHARFAGADLSRLRILISGGAPCPLPIFERFFARGVSFKTGYGLTEAGPNNFWLPEGEVRRKPGSIGRPLLHVEAKVVRPDGSECAPEEVGELLLRGPHLFAGYLGDEAATAAALRQDAGGPWLRTGDLARRDEAGCYSIAGRQKDMYISGGENVYPAEIESVLHGHEAVLEAAVIGVPDPRWGEVGRAVVVLRPGAAVEAEALLAYLRARLAGYKVPRQVVFATELPRTGAGKVDKRRL
jgi:fatty-acyl-CoA synthase